MHDRPADGITVKEHKKGHSEGDPEVRISQDDRDNRTERDDEFSDSEDEGEPESKRRNQDDFSQQGNATAKASGDAMET